MEDQPIQRRERPTDPEAVNRALLVRGFFYRQFRHCCENQDGIMAQNLLSRAELIAQIEKLGEEGVLDDYLPVTWMHVAGIDIIYKGREHGESCHVVILSINGIEHDRFLFSFREEKETDLVLKWED